MKKSLKHLLSATLLLVIAVLLGIGFSSITFADATTPCSVTIEPYGTGCQGVYVSYAGGPEQRVLPEGDTIDVPGGVSVKIRLDIHAGYKHIMTDENAYETTTLEWNQIVNTNKKFTIVCTPKTFDINYLEEGTYNLIAPKTHTYGSKTMIENHPEKTGYNFIGWYQVDDETGANPRKLELNPEGILVLDENFATSDIFLKPMFEKIKYDVTRYDSVYNPGNASGKGGKPLGNVTFRYDVAEIVDGRNGDDVDPGIYRGYEFLSDDIKYYHPSIVVAVTHNAEGELIAVNEVYRFYVPIVYTLEYYNDNGEVLSFGAASTYTYDSATTIADPQRKGYTFGGWKVTVTVDGIENTYTVAPGFVLGNGTDAENEIYTDDNRVIRLTAIWTPNEYDIVYDFGDVKLDSDKAHNDALPTKFVFASLNNQGESVLAIANPIRAGYDFAGWELVELDADGNPIENTKTTIEGDALPMALGTTSYASDIRLTAKWTPKTYSVKLDGNGATAAGTATIENVVFDSPLSVPSGFTPPVRKGFTFEGYYSDKEGGVQYIDKDGNSVCNAWDRYNADASGAITLYARWSRNNYKVTVNVSGIPAGVEGLKIVLRESNGTEHTYTGEPISLPYETQFTIVITAPEGYKTVQWNGSALSEHKALYTSPAVTLEDKDLTLSASVLGMIQIPDITVNYIKETFVLPNGRYLIYLDGVSLNVVVNNGSITVNGDAVEGVTVPESFFGETVKVVCFGDGSQTSDSNPQDFAIVGRPSVPATPDQIHSIDNTYDDQIKINMAEGLEALYEFAVSESAALDGLIWSDSPLLSGLNPGTGYYVFIRVKATESAPYGKAYVAFYTTRIQSYVPEKTKELEDLLGKGDGDIANALIQDAIDRINELANADKLSETFFIEVEKIVADTKAMLPFVRLQDEKIGSLEESLHQNIGTGCFSPENEALLEDICGDAVASISGATTPEDVNAIYEAAVIAMEAIPITYLYGNNYVITLMSQLGLQQGNGLSFVRFTDFETLSRAIDEAIRASGKVMVGSFMPLNEAEKMLKSLDVMAAYHFELNDPTIKDGDQFIIRLQIPEELKDKDGWQVAYYDQASGMIEVLNTRVEGDEIVFEADRVADFVLLANPTLDMTVLIGVLGAILLLQIIAIAMILISRAKNAGVTLNACAALPVFMTIHYVPNDAMLIVLIMGALVVLLQIWLMYLLLSSNLIRLKRKNKTKAQKQQEPTLIVTDAPMGAEEAHDEETLAEEVAAFDLPEEAGEEALADDSLALYEDVDPDVEDIDDLGEEDAWFNAQDSEEGFIEPAANPRYSLPEDGEGFAAWDQTAEESSFALDDEAADTDYVEQVDEEDVYSDEDAYAAEEDAEAFAYDNSAEEEYSAGEYLEDAQSYDDIFGENAEESLNEEFYDETYEAEDLTEEELPLDEEIVEEDAPAQEDDAEHDETLYGYDE